MFLTIGSAYFTVWDLYPEYSLWVKLGLRKISPKRAYYSIPSFPYLLFFQILPILIVFLILFLANFRNWIHRFHIIIQEVLTWHSWLADFTLIGMTPRDLKACRGSRSDNDVLASVSSASVLDSACPGDSSVPILPFFLMECTQWSPICSSDYSGIIL